MIQYSIALAVLLLAAVAVVIAMRRAAQQESNYEDERTLTRFLAEMHPGIVAVSDVQGAIVSTSETFDHHFGAVASAEGSVASVQVILDQESRYNYDNIVKYAIRTQRPVCDFRVTTVADGRKPQMLLTVIPVQTSRGTCAGLINQFEKPDKLIAANADFEHLEKLTNVGQIAAGIAHGLNTPLGAIILSADIIAEMETSVESKEAARKIKSQATHCSRVVKELLRYVKKGGPVARRCVIGTIIERVKNLLESELRERAIRLEVTINTKDDAIICDENQIEQLLINLFSNAFHAIAERGRIMITVNSDALLNQVVVTFTDDGGGIEPRNMERIFEPFFTTKPGVKGTGLGLALCKRIVLEHNGGIEAQSVLGEGATFIMRFPVAS